METEIAEVPMSQPRQIKTRFSHLAIWDFLCKTWYNHITVAFRDEAGLGRCVAVLLDAATGMRYEPLCREASQSFQWCLNHNDELISGTEFNQVTLDIQIPNYPCLTSSNPTINKPFCCVSVHLFAHSVCLHMSSYVHWIEARGLSCGAGFTS